jgi:thioredoxin reductase
VTDRVHEYLIVGAGPAGLQLAHLLAARSRDYLVLEAGAAPGAFFDIFPRHRTLISINKPHTGTDDAELNLRMDWNSLLSSDPELLFTRYTPRYFPAADDMTRYLADFARALELNIRYATRVALIDRDGDGFIATDAAGEVFRARRLVMATGVSKPYVPPIPGIEHAEQYTTMSTDPVDYTDQRVLILGKGNSALETADNLVETAAVIHVAGPHSLRLAWKTHYVGHLRAVNNNFLDTYQLKSQNAVLDGDVQSIDLIDAAEGGGYRVRFSFVRADEVVKELRYDRILCCTGFRFDASVFAEGARPRLVINDRFPEQTAAHESANVPGLYFAGTLMQQRDFKKATTGFIHGFRYTVRALHRILEQRHHAGPWPSRPISGGAAELTAAVLDRVNRSSALWQQFQVMGDVLTRADDGVWRYFEEVPLEYAREGGLAGGADFVAVTLEYGPDHDKVDPFDVTVRRSGQDRPAEAFDAAYLHPVVRLYRDGKAVAEHHVAENLENEWNKPEAHRDPLIAFFEAVLTDSGFAAWDAMSGAAVR